MSGDDVCEELEHAKRYVRIGALKAALEAIEAAERAWRIECDLWADALLEAEKPVRQQ